jgi:hypothetical protein
MRDQLGTILRVGLVVASLCICGAQDNEGVAVFSHPSRTPDEVAKAYSQMPRVTYTPPQERWSHLPRTASILARDGAELRVLMLGDSIITDTSQSRWGDLVQKSYPRCKIAVTTCVRGSTGCWWYKEPGRLKRYVLDARPDLLIIGGISQKDDVDSIREVVERARAERPCDVLLLTGAFGYVDPRDNSQWKFEIDPKGQDYRARLKRLADELKVGFLDMTAQWGKYIRESDKDLDFFKRDAVHANARGEQILGRILAGYLSPPLPATGR